MYRLKVNSLKTEGKPSSKNNSYFFSFTDGIRVRKERDKSIRYFLTAPKNQRAKGPGTITFSLPASKYRMLAYLPWQSALQTIHLSSWITA
jgi:hypothetical protein